MGMSQESFSLLNRFVDVPFQEFPQNKENISKRGSTLFSAKQCGDLIVGNSTPKAGC